MRGAYLSDLPFVLSIRFGGEDGKIVKQHVHNFDDVGSAHAKLNEALGWNNVVEVELVMVLKRVRPARKRDWTREPPPVVVERATLRPTAHGRGAKANGGRPKLALPKAP